jgi:hypothetical protein
VSVYFFSCLMYEVRRPISGDRSTSGTPSVAAVRQFERYEGPVRSSSSSGIRDTWHREPITQAEPAIRRIDTSSDSYVYYPPASSVLARGDGSHCDGPTTRPTVTRGPLPPSDPQIVRRAGTPTRSLEDGPYYKRASTPSRAAVPSAAERFAEYRSAREAQPPPPPPRTTGYPVRRHGPSPGFEVTDGVATGRYTGRTTIVREGEGRQVFEQRCGPNGSLTSPLMMPPNPHPSLAVSRDYVPVSSSLGNDSIRPPILYEPPARAVSTQFQRYDDHPFELKEQGDRMVYHSPTVGPIVVGDSGRITPGRRSADGRSSPFGAYRRTEAPVQRLTVDDGFADRMHFSPTYGVQTASDVRLPVRRATPIRREVPPQRSLATEPVISPYTAYQYR